MKKFLTLLSLIFAMFVFVSCVSDDDDEEAVDTGTSDTAADSGKEGDTDTAADSGSENPSDPSDTSDTSTPSDPTDTTPSDPSDPNCQPNCAGKQCGSDGCGGICGTCGEGKICDVGTFTCKCNRNCDGTTCGDDGCGGKCTCQNLNDTCDEQTKTCKCTPNCDGKECGEDGCGGKCGTCGSGLFCDNGKCAESKCGEKICGEDEFGNPCGGCDYKERCSIDQTQCISCSCVGRECGSDGCGGLCGNGGCGDGQGCNAEGKCVPCTCEGKVCGINECGSYCGNAESGKDGCRDQICSADQTQCLEVQCTAITLSDLVLTSAADPAHNFLDYAAEYSPNGGSSKNHFSLKISKPSSASLTIDLAHYPFNTCTREKPDNEYGVCAFIKEYTGEIVTKLYYAKRGFLHIPSINPNGSFIATVPFQQPVFVEVDMVTGVPVPDGKCYKITNGSINAKGK